MEEIDRAGISSNSEADVKTVLFCPINSFSVIKRLNSFMTNRRTNIYDKKVCREQLCNKIRRMHLRAQYEITLPNTIRCGLLQIKTVTWPY